MNKNILSGLIGTLAAVALVVCATAAPTPFRIVVMGDSMMWGQGLLEEDKIHSRLTNMLHDCLGYGPFDITQLAHSGVPIGVEGENGDTHDYPGEIPWFDPTILKQCEVFTNAPEGVNLVLLDGGINDVGPNNVLDPCLSTNRLSTDLEAHFHLRMSNLLEKVSRKFTTATVIVCNGYPCVSEESAAGLVPAFLTAMGLNCLSNVISDVIVAKCRQVVMEGAQKLMAAVDDVNTRNLRVGRSVRIVFADARFGPANAIFAPQSWLWGGTLNPTAPFWPPLLPEDSLARQRLCECSNAMPALEFGRSNLCVIAGGGHPNPKGAQAYADAAFAAYLDTDGLVRWNGGSGEWHTADNWTPNRVPGSDDTVLITNGTVEVNSPATAGHVIVKGGTLTHRRGVAGGLQLTVVGTLRVLEPGQIDVTERGLRGGNRDGNAVVITGGYFYGEGYSNGVPAAINGNGASHGTLGGNNPPNGFSPIQPLYGSPTDPVLFGSGGYSAGGFGGNGGGLVRVTAQSVVLEGAIKADGGSSDSGGSGSGGSVNLLLTGGTFSGAGSITVTGGPSINGYANGGHGRIAVRSIGTNQFAGTYGSAGSVFVQVINTGGALVLDNTTLVIQTNSSLTIDTFQTRPNGAATVVNRGTLILGTNHLTVPSGLTLFQDGLVQGSGEAAGIVGAMTVHTNGVLTHTRGQTNGVQLTLTGTLRVETGGKIDVSDRGLRGGNREGNAVVITGGYLYGEGYSNGVPAPINGNGASHGTLGGNNPPNSFSPIQPLYGSPTDPVLFGSGGYSAGGFGGNGGGLVRITAQSLVLEGAIKADGGSSDSGGSGSGGSVNLLLTGGTFSGAGTITVTGGPSINGYANGGHGRIAVRSIGTNQFAGTYGSAGSVFVQVINTGGALVLDNTTLVIQTNSSLTIDTFQTRPNGAATVVNRGTLILGTNHLTVPSGLTLFQDGLVQGSGEAAGIVGAMTVHTNGVLTHTRGQTNGVQLTLSGTLRVETGGKIDVSDRGLRGGNREGNAVVITGGYLYGEGYSNGVPAPINGNGASHGTLGGNNPPNGFSPIQPLYGSPTDPVLFGSGGYSAGGFGGNGGGLVRITAQSLVLEGAIKADGGSSDSGGSGSGGSVNLLLTGGTFSGAGTITVAGGPSINGNPNGGHGRIAVRSIGTNQFAGTYGSAGSVFVQVINTGGALVLDNTTLVIQTNSSLTIDTFQTRPNGAATVVNRGTLILGTNHLTVPSGLTLFQDGLVQGSGEAAGIVGAMTVHTNGVLTHTRGQTNGVQLTLSGTLRVETGGKIDVSDRGLRGGNREGNAVVITGGYLYGEGYSNGVPAPINGNGASHGTLGGNNPPNGFSPIQPLYGSPTDPVLFGSGGYSAGGFGGNGGGLVRITAQSLVLEGAIKADGGSSDSGGSGSGGSVNLLLAGGTFSGAGTITVDGGPSINGNPNGGCGRIAVVGHTTNAFTGSFSCGTVYLNARPRLPAQSDRTVDELTLFTVNNAAWDADLLNTLSYTFLAAPGSAVVSSGGLITWTPSEAAGPSTNIITVVVSDNALRPLTATNTFTVIVNEVNVAPVLSLPANMSVNELVPFSAQATATDSDLPANPLSFALVSGPAGLSVLPDGVIQWTPSEAQGPGTHIVTLRVTDLNPSAVNATSLSVTSSFQIVVNEVNIAPMLTVPSDQSFPATALLSVNATATDADSPANTLTFGLVSGPSGLLVGANGLITWSPGDAQAGTTSIVTVSVTDNGVPRLSATQSFTITVVPRPILSIRPDGTNAVISWRVAVTGFTLEYTTQLGSGVWTTESASVVDTATEHTITVPANAGRGFYRLKK